MFSLKATADALLQSLFAERTTALPATSTASALAAADEAWPEHSDPKQPVAGPADLASLDDRSAA